jgi:hypothetical protein
MFHDITPTKKPQNIEIKKIKKEFKLKSIFSMLVKSNTYKKIVKKLSSSSKKEKTVWAIVIVILAISFASYRVLINNTDSDGIKSSNGNNLLKLKRGTPAFSALIPNGKNIKDLDARINDGGQPLFFFSDKIAQSTITVSQQPLPESFKNNTAGQIEILAKNSGANDIITVGEVTVYIARPPEGLENIIFTKNGLLIYIKTSARLTNEQWSIYISSLQ